MSSSHPGEGGDPFTPTSPTFPWTPTTPTFPMEEDDLTPTKATFMRQNEATISSQGLNVTPVMATFPIDPLDRNTPRRAEFLISEPVLSPNRAIFTSECFTLTNDEMKGWLKAAETEDGANYDFTETSPQSSTPTTPTAAQSTPPTCLASTGLLSPATHNTAIAASSPAATSTTITGSSPPATATNTTESSSPPPQTATRPTLKPTPPSQLLDRRRRRHRDLLLTVTRLTFKLAALHPMPWGPPHPHFPRNLLNFLLLTDAELDSLARYYHQSDFSVWTYAYPETVNWDLEWLAHLRESRGKEAEVDVKRRKFGKFIGLRGCETPREESEEWERWAGRRDELMGKAEDVGFWGRRAMR
ncbi:MAG: hypothetical protein M1831_007436 [Alyxoria varia]|nr:MAG: hypothetical protein M1831_007436 [Alyxoria varia]